MSDSANAIIVYNKKVLLLLRDNIAGITDPNCWGLIGGGVETGETFEEAMLREMKEEISIIPRRVIYIGKLSVPGNYTSALFYVKLTDNELSKIQLGNEGQELRLLSIDEMGKLDLTQWLRIYYNRYASYMKRILEDEEAPESRFLGLNT